MLDIIFNPLYFPFGKYKGKNVLEVLDDENYCKWLLKKCDTLKNKKYNEIRELIERRWGCKICHDDSRGMYGGEGEYIPCPQCNPWS